MAASRGPVFDMFVDVYDSTGRYAAQGRTNGAGIYVSDRALASGSYYDGLLPVSA